MIVTIIFNADAIAWVATRLFGGIGWLAPVLRTAIAYPLSTRFRTGMAMVMFAMIVCTVTLMAVVIEATQSLIVARREAERGLPDPHPIHPAQLLRPDHGLAGPDRGPASGASAA